MKVKLVALNARFTHSCLALFCIRHELEKYCAEIDCELCQHTINDSYYELLVRLAENAPDYIFFSSLIWNSDLVEKLLVDLRSRLVNAWFVVGGPQAQIVRNNVGDQQTTYVLGEIEAVTQKFWEDLKARDLQPEYSGKFLQSSQQNLPFSYREQDFKEHLQNRHVYYESSRGCPFSCSYCLSSVEKGIFHKPLDQVYDEIDALLEADPMVIRFVDRTFNDIPSRALDIWRHIVSKNRDTLFHFEVAPDRFTPEMIAFLETVPDNIFQFEIGIQSTNVKTLKEIRRMVDSNKAEELIKKIAEPNNIHIHLDLILGLPYETEETFAQSFRDVFRMESHYIQMGLLKLLPGTRIAQKAEEYGYVASQAPPYSVFSSKWMEADQLTDLYWFCECVEKFLNNRYFVSLWKYLRKTEEDIYVFFRAILDICRSSNFFDFAATHELMGQILLDCCRGRSDFDLVFELLTYDWLRCGHRFFPAFLQTDSQDEEHDHRGLQQIKKHLFHSSPQNIEGLYNEAEKSKFFKKSLFLPFSLECLEELGFSVEPQGEAYICFMHERERFVHKLCRTELLFI